VDTETKRIKKITPEISDPYGEPFEKSVFDEPFKDKITVPEDLKLNFNYTIQRRDIDTNGHVNNLHYIDYALETLDEDIYNNNSFDNLEVVYKKEIKLKESIKCYYSFEDNKHIVTIKSEDDSTVHAIVKLY
jgi:acyl-ACP thioesterase